jgi:hypothetical protein
MRALRSRGGEGRLSAPPRLRTSGGPRPAVLGPAGTLPAVGLILCGIAF